MEHDLSGHLRRMFVALWTSLAAVLIVASPPNAHAQLERQVIDRIVEGGLITQHHGEFPSYPGNWTHPGIDVAVAQSDGCGFPVYPASAGEVVKTITRVDSAFSYVGNAVMIRHDQDNGPPVFSTYFHLQDAPEVTVGPITSDTIIGHIGKTGSGSGCHLHLEIRRFESGDDMLNPNEDVSNVYLQGDQRWSPLFSRDWIDPILWTEAQHVKIEPINPRNLQRIQPHDVKTFTERETIIRQFSHAGSFMYNLVLLAKGHSVHVEGVAGDWCRVNPVESHWVFCDDLIEPVGGWPLSNNSTIDRDVVSISDRIDGAYYSAEYDYSFDVRGSVGICTKSNSPLYSIGQVMFTFKLNDDGSFVGKQIYTDGKWYNVSGKFYSDRVEMSGNGFRWTMSRH